MSTRSASRRAAAIMAGIAVASAMAIVTASAQIPGARIEKLIGDGWEIAGYVTAWENRSLILFRHKEHKYLIQCSVLIDVTRNPRVQTTCYELR